MGLIVAFCWAHSHGIDTWAPVSRAWMKRTVQIDEIDPETMPLSLPFLD